MNELIISNNKEIKKKLNTKIQEVVQLLMNSIEINTTLPKNNDNELNERLSQIQDEFNDYKTKTDRKLELLEEEIVNDFNHFDKRVDEAAKYIATERENWDKAFERTNTLKGHKKDNKLKKYVHNKIYKRNGDQSTLVSRLFHGDMVAMVWSEMYDIFSVSSYGDIPITEENKAYRVVDSVINGWDIEVIRRRILNNYRERKDNNSLPNSKMKYYDEYLLKTEGGLKVVENKETV